MLLQQQPFLIMTMSTLYKYIYIHIYIYMYTYTHLSFDIYISNCITYMIIYIYICHPFLLQHLPVTSSFFSFEAMSSIASSGGLVSSGGPYYMISRALGAKLWIFQGDDPALDLRYIYVYIHTLDIYTIYYL